MMPVEQSVLVAIVLFVIGLVYHAGRQSQRIDDLQARHAELARDLRADIADVKGLLRAVIGEWRQLREAPPHVGELHDDG